MKGIAAQYIYNADKTIKKQGLILTDNNNVYIHTADLREEIHSTVFYNGLIIPVFNINFNRKIITERSLIFAFIAEKLKTAENLKTNLIDILDNFADVPALLSGNKYDFWCFENIDLTTFQLLQEAKLSSVNTSSF